ncbi:MAG: long-chain-fatty-acid--CoA ligase [Desulfobacterales bacterium]|nr:long-chain-fatty-acid--CoA ligase [Desulfobacterales bacterium]
MMNLGIYLDNSVEKYKDAPFLYYYDTVVTYQEFGDKVNILANSLLKLGFKKGDFIHVLVQNSPETLVAYFAIQKIGAIAGPVNGWWKAAEVKYLLNDSKGRGLIIEDQYMPVLEEIRKDCPNLEIVIEIGKNPSPKNIAFSKLMEEGNKTIFKCASDAEDIAYIFYTSGTTGNPKGVLLSHKNVFADIEGITKALNIGEKQTILIFLPLFHVNAMLTTSFGIGVGQKVVLRKAFSASEFWEVVDKYKVNYWSAVPAVYQILLQDPGRQQYDLSSLKFGICGAAPLSTELFNNFQDTFKIPIVEGYGLTEATCVSTINPRDGIRKVGSIGIPIPGQTVKIVDDNGNELPPNTPGEIVISGDVVMKGYYNKPKETADTIRNGALHTGDVAIKDEDGYIFIVDRKKDMIIRGGENIYPKEIDNFLATHPKILEAATVGVPDKTMGEEIKVFVRAKDSSLTEQEVIDFCKQNLAKYKVPKFVEILDEDFPRSAVGKVLKKDLRKWGSDPRPKKKSEDNGVTVENIFGTMESRVNPDGVKGVTANYGYAVTGEGGGEWTVSLKDGVVKVLKGLHNPNVTTTVDARDWIDLTLGKLDGMMAFSAGKLKVQGDMGLLMKAAKFFKKYTPPSAQGQEEKPREELIQLKKILSIPQRFATGPVMGKFLKGLIDKKIFANKCPKCGRLQLPPREVCAECRVRADEWVEVGPFGIITTYDIAYYASPDPLTGETRETPYCSAHFLLDGCKNHETLWHELNPNDISKVKKGAKVKPIWNDKRQGAITDILYFEIID